MIHSKRRHGWHQLLAAALIICLAVSVVHAQKRATPAPKAPDSFATMNVCERVPGEAVARAVEGKLLDVRPVNIAGFAAARCVYGVDINSARQTLVLWFKPAADYDDLRKAASGLVKPLPDIGDAAHLTVDSESKRVIVTATQRNTVTIQATGEREEWVRSLATLAMSKFP